MLPNMKSAPRKQSTEQDSEEELLDLLQNLQSWNNFPTSKTKENFSYFNDQLEQDTSYIFEIANIEKVTSYQFEHILAQSDENISETEKKDKNTTSFQKSLKTDCK